MLFQLPINFDGLNKAKIIESNKTDMFWSNVT